MERGSLKILSTDGARACRPIGSGKATGRFGKGRVANCEPYKYEKAHGQEMLNFLSVPILDPISRRTEMKKIIQTCHN